MTEAPVAGHTPGSVSEILNAAADLIEPEGAWTQLGGDDDGSDGECARDANGTPVSATDKEAQCWCLFGAIDRVTGGHDTQIVRAIEWLSCKRSDELVAFNDDPDRTQAEVVAALRQAAQTATGEQS